MVNLTNFYAGKSEETKRRLTIDNEIFQASPFMTDIYRTYVMKFTAVTKNPTLERFNGFQKVFLELPVENYPNALHYYREAVEMVKAG